MSNMKGMSTGSNKTEQDDRDSEGGVHAMHSMEGHMDMGHT